jgi:DNA-binding XRE family transcriptional regulator
MGLRNFLRLHRRSWHLTQEELAFLFGYHDQSIVARLEQEERAITLAVAHACEVLFGLKPSEIFPTLFHNIEEDVVARMHELRDRLLASTPTQKTLAKLKLLEEGLRRIADYSDQEV